MGDNPSRRPPPEIRRAAAPSTGGTNCPDFCEFQPSATVARKTHACGRLEVADFCGFQSPNNNTVLWTAWPSGTRPSGQVRLSSQTAACENPRKSARKSTTTSDFVRN